LAGRVGLSKKPGHRARVELACGSDDDTARRESERDQHPRRKIEAQKAAELPPPSALEERIREEEGHVDAYGRRRGAHEIVALIGADRARPVPARRGAGKGGEGRLERRGGREDGARTGNEPGEDRGGVEPAVGDRQPKDDEKEA